MKPRDIVIITESERKIRFEDTTADVELIISRGIKEKIKDIRVERLVPDIKDGSVFDHIYPGVGIELYKILDLDDVTTVLLTNVPSKKYRRKDVVKVYGWYPGEEDFNSMNKYFSSLPPGQQRLTLNIIENFNVIKKYIFVPEEGLRKYTANPL